MRHTYTQSYSILECAAATWNDIEARLKEVNMDGEYIDDDKIIFGSVALIKEPLNVTWTRENLEIINNRE